MCLDQSTLAVWTNTPLTVPVNVRRSCWRQLNSTTGGEGRISWAKVCEEWRNHLSCSSRRVRATKKERKANKSCQLT